MKNTHITIVMEDGRNADLTLNFKLLYMLREKNKKAYDEYNKIVMNGAAEMLDYADALHTAYLCACMEKGIEPEMSKDEFTENLPYDMNEVVDVYSELYDSGKKVAFRRSFESATGIIKIRNRKKSPKIEFESIADCYTYFVIMLGMSEDLFWNADVSFLKTVYEDKQAYDRYVDYLQQEG